MYLPSEFDWISQSGDVFQGFDIPNTENGFWLSGFSNNTFVGSYFDGGVSFVGFTLKDGIFTRWLAPGDAGGYSGTWLYCYNGPRTLHLRSVRTRSLGSGRCVSSEGGLKISQNDTEDPSSSSGMGFLLPRMIPPARFLDIPERLLSLKRFQRDGGVDALGSSLRNR